MYAIIEVGSKQYQVKKGDIIEVEKLTSPEGKEIAINKVLLVSRDKKVEVGQPYLKGTEVKLAVLKQFKAGKAVSFKYLRRKSSRWKKGHRQQMTRLEVKGIESGS
ncbi:MAG: 50S ribosomal protein L21 [Candidatus Omnitrophota bacterium]|jgi:large subunit ribosomal protein L21